MSVVDSTERAADQNESLVFSFRSCGVCKFTFFTKRSLDRHELLRWHNASARHLFWFIQETYRKRTMFPLSHIPSNRSILQARKKFGQKWSGRTGRGLLVFRLMIHPIHPEVNSFYARLVTQTEPADPCRGFSDRHGGTSQRGQGADWDRGTRRCPRASRRTGY